MHGHCWSIDLDRGDADFALMRPARRQEPVGSSIDCETRRHAGDVVGSTALERSLPPMVKPTTESEHLDQP